jgi:hypothetical protein
LIVSGVTATRVSPGRISLGMPIRIDTTFQYRSARRTNHEGREEHQVAKLRVFAFFVVNFPNPDANAYLSETYRSFRWYRRRARVAANARDRLTIRA